jgi:hypothetical protein
MAATQQVTLEEYLTSDKFISDDVKEQFVDKFVLPQYRYLFDKEQLSKSGGAFDPPFLFNEANTHPLKMPALLFPTRENPSNPNELDKVIFDGGLDSFYVDPRLPEQATKKGVSENTKRAVHKIHYDELIECVIQELKENANLDISYFPSPPGRKLSAGHLCSFSQTKKVNGRSIVFYCTRCCNIEEGLYTPVIVGIFGLEHVAAPKDHVKVTIEFTEFWFHNQNCQFSFKKCDEFPHYKEADEARKKAPGKGGQLANAPGYELIQAAPGKRFEQLRSLAYGRWLEMLKLYQKPGNPTPKGRNPKQIGMPPGSKIHFSVDKKIRRDNRMQQALTGPPDGWSDLVDLQAHTQFLAWHLVRLISRYNLVQEWTSYRPHPNPKGWELFEASGMQLDPTGQGLLSAGKKPFLHQMSHGDFPSPNFKKVFSNIKNKAEEDFVTATNSPLLRGLHHPFTFNVALETERSIWISNIHHVVTFEKNQTLAISADTTHGGYSWNAHEHKDMAGQFLYKPSLHCVLGSVRHPQIPDTVHLTISSETYCPKVHLQHMGTEQLEQLLEYHDEILDEVKELLDQKKHKNVGGKTKRRLAKIRQQKKIFESESESDEIAEYNTENLNEKTKIQQPQPIDIRKRKVIVESESECEENNTDNQTEKAQDEAGAIERGKDGTTQVEGNEAPAEEY